MLDEEVTRSLLAGWLAGAVAALVSTALILLAFVHDSYWRRRLDWTRLPVPLAGFIVIVFMLLLWTLAGLLIGAVHVSETQPGFSLAVATAIAAASLAIAIRRRHLDPLTWQLTLVALASYTLLMPALAGVL